MFPGELSALVTREFPFPIAHTVRRLAEEGDSREGCCEVLQKTLEFLGCVLMAAYTSSDDRGPALDGDLHRLLEKPQPSGVWRDWIIKILEQGRVAPHPPLHASLYGLLERRAQKELADLIFARNRWVHGGRRFRVDEFERGLAQLLGRLQPIHRSSLLCPHAERTDGSLRVIQCTLLRGDSPVFTELEVRTDALLEPERIYMYTPDTGELLSLHPWMTLARCDRCPGRHFFQLDRVASQKVVYASIPGGHEKSSGQAFLLLEGIFGGTKPERQRPRHFHMPGDIAALPRTLKPGHRVGPYEIEDLIHLGGASQVYRVHDPRKGTRFALKLLSMELSRDTLLLRRFEDELHKLKTLAHPNVISLKDAGADFGERYLVFDLAEGGRICSAPCTDLSQARKPLPEEAIVDIGRQACAGLEYIHSRGIVHRDLKPSNLLVMGDRIVITDFGIARGTTDPRITMTGMLVGTPEYMAPEQIQDGEVDHRTDLYALGCVLYELATGRPPYRSSTPLGTASYQLRASPIHVRDINPHASRGLTNVIFKLLQKSPGLRYQSAKELSDHLLRASTDPAGPQIIEGDRTPQDRAVEVELREAAKFWFRLRIVIATAATIISSRGGTSARASSTPAPRTSWASLQGALEHGRAFGSSARSNRS